MLILKLRTTGGERQHARRGHQWQRRRPHCLAKLNPIPMSGDDASMDAARASAGMPAAAATTAGPAPFARFFWHFDMLCDRPRSATATRPGTHNLSGGHARIYGGHARIYYPECSNVNQQQSEQPKVTGQPLPTRRNAAYARGVREAVAAQGRAGAGGAEQPAGVHVIDIGTGSGLLALLVRLPFEFRDIPHSMPFP